MCVNEVAMKCRLIPCCLKHTDAPKGMSILGFSNAMSFNTILRIFAFIALRLARFKNSEGCTYSREVKTNLEGRIQNL